MKTKTLTIHFFSNTLLILKMSGLSIKSVKPCYSLSSSFIRIEELNCYGVSLTRFEINGDTAQVERELLIKWLKELYQEFEFDSIKIKGYHSEFTDSNKLYETIAIK